MNEARRPRVPATKPNASLAEAFRCPPGSVAFTFDIAGAAPSTAVFAAEDLTHGLAEAGRAIPASVPYHQLVAGFAAEFRRAKAAGCSAKMPGLGLLGSCLAMNHPVGGDAMRRAVSTALRREGRAHVTFCLSAAGLALALAPAFDDLAPIAAAAPQDTVLYAVAPPEPEVMQ